MALKLVSKPANYPVTLTEAKAHLREDSDDFNLQIEAMIAAATGYASWYQGRTLIDQTWDLHLDKFPVDQIKIPMPPLIEVQGVYYTDSAGVEQEFGADGYVVDAASEPGRVVLVNGGSWPTISPNANSVRVRFRAGYLNQSDSPPTDAVPFETKAAILIHVADLYANRESVVVGDSVATIPWSAEQLLRCHKHRLGMA